MALSPSDPYTPRWRGRWPRPRVLLIPLSFRRPKKRAPPLRRLPFRRSAADRWSCFFLALLPSRPRRHGRRGVSPSAERIAAADRSLPERLRRLRFLFVRRRRFASLNVVGHFSAATDCRRGDPLPSATARTLMVFIDSIPIVVRQSPRGSTPDGNTLAGLFCSAINNLAFQGAGGAAKPPYERRFHGQRGTKRATLPSSAPIGRRGRANVDWLATAPTGSCASRRHMRVIRCGLRATTALAVAVRIVRAPPPSQRVCFTHGPQAESNGSRPWHRVTRLSVDRRRFPLILPLHRDLAASAGPSGRQDRHHPRGIAILETRRRPRHRVCVPRALYESPAARPPCRTMTPPRRLWRSAVDRAS